jgi:hypothetical protein
MKIFKLTSILAVLAAVGVFAYFAHRARTDLVTLDVRNEDLAQVVKKIEWQTWETIVVQKDIQAKITLNVRKMPLEEVLNLLGEQSAARWTSLYPIYSTSQKKDALERYIRLGLPMDQAGWSALNSVRFQRGAMFAANALGAEKRLNLALESKPVKIVAQAISRSSRATVVAEDGTDSLVSLDLKDATIAEAVQSLAGKTKRKWDHLYAIQKESHKQGPSSELASEEERPNKPEGARPGGDMGKRVAQLQDLTPDERAAKLKEMGMADEMIKRAQAMAAMTPEQRQQAFANRAASPDFQDRRQQRLLNNIKNTTPEQRVDRFQKFSNRRS